MLRKVETVLAALLLVRLGAVVCSKVTPAPVNNPDYQYLYKQTVSNAAARGALCNDGTPAVFYYRNCTANGDRRAGDPTNYCAKGGTQGVQSVQWFVYLDPADSLFCHDKQSCSHRPAQLQTSTGLPDRVFLSGWFSPYPEQNPNFYKQHSVYIPSCSSDLFVGTAGKDAGSGLFFGGRNIVRAVLEDLQALDMTFEGVAAPLVQADQVVIGGGAGAMLLLDSIRVRVHAVDTRLHGVHVHVHARTHAHTCCGTCPWCHLLQRASPHHATRLLAAMAWALLACMCAHNMRASDTQAVSAIFLCARARPARWCSGSLQTWLPKNVTDVRAVCDGCVIPDIEPLGTMRSELPCKDDAHCPPMTSLRQAVDVWVSCSSTPIAMVVLTCLQVSTLVLLKWCGRAFKFPPWFC